jgi:hypothetical protein
MKIDWNLVITVLVVLAVFEAVKKMFLSENGKIMSHVPTVL